MEKSESERPQQGLVYKLCKDEVGQKKFEELDTYLKKLELSDLLNEKVLEMLPQDIPNIPHRVLMRVFLETVVRPYLDARENHVTKRHSQPVVSELQVLARGSLGGDLYVQPSLEAFVVNFDDYLPAKVGKFSCVDLSDNFITSKEMELVLLLAQHLVHKALIGEECVLLLSNNRIHGIDEETKDRIPLILEKLTEIFSVVDVRGNPFCTVDRGDFFQSLDSSSRIIQRLIFIPAFYLEQRRWEAMLKDVETRVVAYNVHRAYFDRISWGR
ncbi:hypothetical protein MIR68_009098 [Amoeboaphelidium protococcarum]|nr:hypothetical protein MIR68_009098 [Amoeboaphelidium protococcarum]